MKNKTNLANSVSKINTPLENHTIHILNELTELSECANVSLDKVLKDYCTLTSKKILENHTNKIYYSESEKLWCTYVKDETLKRGRKPLKDKSQEGLDDKIVAFYKAKHKRESKQSITLEDVYKKWLIYRRDETAVKNKTIQKNVYDWNALVAGKPLAATPLCEIRPITLIRFFRKLTKDRKYSSKRMGNLRSILNGIMDYSVEEELIEHNPVLDVKLKNFTYKAVADQSENVFTQNETITLLTYLATVKDEPFAVAIQLMFYLFIRVGELKAIKWSDVNLEKRTVHLEKQALLERELQDDLTFAPQQTKVIEGIKGNTSSGIRTLHLTDEAVAILKKARLLNPFGEYVFEPWGRLMTTNTFNRRLARYCADCGIEYHSSHKIRFYNASTAFDGKNLVALSKQMGHSEVATTIQYLRNVKKENVEMSIYNNLGLQQVKAN